MDKTTEEIVKEHYGCGCHEMYSSRGMVDPSCTLHEHGPEMELMMDEYAKQQATGFIDWMQYLYIPWNMKEGLYYHRNDLLKHIDQATVYTTNQVYDLYLLHLQNSK